MDCQEVQSRITDGLLDDLGLSVQPVITEHLNRCSTCARATHKLKLVDQYLKKSFGQIPISQSLSGDFISRVHKKIQSKRKGFKRRLVYKTALTAAVVLIGLVLYFVFNTSQTRILEGTIYLEVESKSSKLLKNNDLLPLGQTIKTKGNQFAKVKLRDGSIIELAPETVLAFKSDSYLGGRLINLEEGEIQCQVISGGAFRIIMPAAELNTLGTEFIVRLSTNKKEIAIPLRQVAEEAITSQYKRLAFITSATVKVSVFSGKVLLTTEEGQIKLQKEIKAGETVVGEINPPLPVELETEIKSLINQLSSKNETIREQAFLVLVKIGCTAVPFLEKVVTFVNSVQASYITRLLEMFKRPNTLWSHEMPQIEFTFHPPIISDNQLYLVSCSRLYALDCVKGNVIWEFPQAPLEIRNGESELLLTGQDGFTLYQSGTGFNSAPLLEDDIIYLGTLGGTCFALAAQTGRVIWHQEGFGPIQSTPTISNETLYLGSSEPGTNRGRFYALDARTGKIKWMTSISGIIAGSQAVIYDHLVFVGAWNNKLYAFNTKTGEQVWDYETSGIITTAPLLYEDLVYVGSWDGRLYALSAKNGIKQWSFQTDSAIIEAPVELGKIIYWGTKHKIYAFDREKCTVIWTYNRERFSIGTINAVGDKVYLGTDGGKLIALDTSTGEETWRYDLTNKDSSICTITGSPTIFNDVLYIVSCPTGIYTKGNKLHALKLK